MEIQTRRCFVATLTQHFSQTSNNLELITSQIYIRIKLHFPYYSNKMESSKIEYEMEFSKDECNFEWRLYWIIPKTHISCSVISEDVINVNIPRKNSSTDVSMRFGIVYLMDSLCNLSSVSVEIRTAILDVMNKTNTVEIAEKSLWWRSSTITGIKTRIFVNCGWRFAILILIYSIILFIVWNHHPQYRNDDNDCIQY